MQNKYLNFLVNIRKKIRDTDFRKLSRKNNKKIKLVLIVNKFCKK